MPTPSLTPQLSLSLTEAEVQGLVHLGFTAAMDDLQRRSGARPAQLQVVGAEHVTWRDSSLGCPEPNRFYTQVLTPGSRLFLSYQGQPYVYHAADSRAFLCNRSERSEPFERHSLVGLWSRLAPLRTPRSEVAAAELNGKIYVFGGFGAGATANEEYDPISNSWRQRAPIPKGVDHAAAVAAAGQIFLIGGFDGRFGPVNTTWAYDPRTDVWTRKADLPTPRGALGAALVDGKIYAIGGRGAQGDLGNNEAYDPATDRWRSRSPMPTPRDHIAIAAVGRKIYVIGGRLGTFARNLGDNEEYDPRTDTWLKKAPLPTPRSGISAAVVDGKIYVFGGESVQGTFNASERFDPLTEVWEAMPALPTARHGLGAVALANRVYVLAGGPTPGGSQSALNEVFLQFPANP